MTGLTLEEMVVAARDIAELELRARGRLRPSMVGHTPGGPVDIRIDLEGGEEARKRSARKARRALRDHGCIAYSFAIEGSADMGFGLFPCLITHIEMPTTARTISYRIVRDRDGGFVELVALPAQQFSGPMQGPFFGLLGRATVN